MAKLNRPFIEYLNDKLHTPTWLFILLIIVFAFRIPTFFEPYSNLTETTYLTLGNALVRGQPIEGVYDQSTPLTYLAAVAGNLFWLKAILALWLLVTIFAFWKLVEVLFPKNLKTQKVATIVFAILTTIPLLEGNIVNAELFMIGPTILGFFILFSQKLTLKNIFLAVVFFLVATLFKSTALLDIAAIALLWLVTNKRLLREKYTLIGNARKKLTPAFAFACAWAATSIAAVVLSGDPKPHDYIQSLPPISLLSGILITRQNKEQTLAIIPLTLALFVPFYYHFQAHPVLPYYARFINLATNNISREKYIESFGSQVSRNYKIAEYLITVTKPEEKIFVWGEAPPIYALTRKLPLTKYVADYHIRDFSSPEETILTLSQNMPTFVVVLPGTPELTELDMFLSKNYGLTEEIEGATIWKLLSPSVRSLLS